MDLRQIRQFIVLAEELNFRKAAERLHITQPPLSATIRRLEEDLQVQLFERTQHAVALTAAGHVFLGEARRVLGHVQEAVAVTRNTAQGFTGTLRVSCVPSALLDLLPAALRSFHKKYPLVRVVVSRELSTKQREEVQQERVDVAILIPDANFDDDRLALTHLRDEHFVLACPSDHRLAAQPTARIQEIDVDPLLSFFSLAESPGFLGPLMKAFKASDFHPNVIHDHAQWGTSLVMVAGGFGLAIVPRPMGLFPLSGVSYVELVHDDGEPITYPVAAAVSTKRRNPVAENFVATLAELARDGTFDPSRPASSAKA